MKRRLDEITVDELINIAESGKVDSEARRIMFEYRSIADEAGARKYLREESELMKATARVTLFTMCSNLVRLGCINDVRSVLEVYGIHSSGMSESRLKAEVSSQIERARYDLAKLEELKSKTAGGRDVRKSFDEQTAALMAHFKFQIDTSEMKASLYAHLIARCAREVKAQNDAMKNHKI